VDDQVLLKSDGFPTYHLANVVDDHLMAISHVIRAEEWISSTPKHLLLYQAFGWDPPAFVHMPLLRNPDRSKLSKRKNPTSMDWYRDQGYLPEALLNFLARMGWSTSDDEEVFSLDRMIADFAWDRVSKTGPIFDMKKLDWLNGVYIRELPEDELLGRLQETVLQARDADESVVKQVLPIVRERMKKLADFAPLTDFLFQEEVAPSREDLVAKRRSAEETAAALERVARALAEAPGWDPEPLDARCRGIAEAMGWKTRDLFMPIRVAVTGARVSPPLFESMTVLGREKSLARIKRGAAMLQGDLA